MGDVTGELIVISFDEARAEDGVFLLGQSQRHFLVRDVASVKVRLASVHHARLTA